MKCCVSPTSVNPVFELGAHGCACIALHKGGSKKKEATICDHFVTGLQGDLQSKHPGIFKSKGRTANNI